MIEQIQDGWYWVKIHDGDEWRVRFVKSGTVLYENPGSLEYKVTGWFELGPRVEFPTGTTDESERERCARIAEQFCEDQQCASAAASTDGAVYSADPKCSGSCAGALIAKRIRG